MHRDILRGNTLHHRARFAVENIGEGDFLLRPGDGDINVVFRRDQLKLFGQIGRKQIGPCDGGGVGAQLLKPAKGAPTVGHIAARRARAGVMQGELGIGVTAIFPLARRRYGSITAKGDDVTAKGGHCVFVVAFKLL